MTRFGVNYVPSRDWWYCWVDWDSSSIAADLEAIAALGCDHIRIHCLWPLFQPNPAWVSPLMLDHLGELLDIADRAGLDVVVTVFNGWLSGFDFRPAWVPEQASIFADRDVIDAELRLLAAIAGRIAGHPRFLGFDVANEPSVLAGDRNATTREQGDAWVRELLAGCETVAPGGFHTVGMDHVPWLKESAFGRPVLGETGSATPVHAWVFFTGALERYGEDGTGSTHLAEYLLELAKAYGEPGRPVWLQEYGASIEWLTTGTPAGFLDRATAAALTVGDLWGITWWCSHDIDRSLGGFIDLEYDLGLLTVDNVVKSEGERFRSIIAAARPDPVARPTALVLPDGVTPDLAFADAFFALIDRGVHPAIVLAARSTDAGHLAARGITEVVSA